MHMTSVVFPRMIIFKMWLYCYTAVECSKSYGARRCGISLLPSMNPNHKASTWQWL